MDLFSTLTLALGSAWTSGVNLYATVAVLGLLQKFGAARLPGGLEVLDNWWIIGVAAALYLVEFVADKIPYVDSVWDAIHTFIRVPAGAILALSATTELDPTVQTLALLLGGGVALSSHGTKATARAFANLSPEPVSNWALSLTEDVLAIGGVILAVFLPAVVAVLLVIFLILFLWIAPTVVRKLWRMATAIRGFFVGENFHQVARKAA